MDRPGKSFQQAEDSPGKCPCSSPQDGASREQQTCACTVYYWKVEQVIESADGCRMMHDSLTPDQLEIYCPGRRTTTRGWISSTRPWRKFPLHFTIFVTSASPTIILAQEGRDLHLERTLHNGECLREEPQA